MSLILRQDSYQLPLSAPEYPISKELPWQQIHDFLDDPQGGRHPASAGDMMELEDGLLRRHGEPDWSFFADRKELKRKDSISAFERRTRHYSIQICRVARLG